MERTELRVVVSAGDDGDLVELAELTDRLRRTLLDGPVDDVRPEAGEAGPADSKGLDASTAGTLLVEVTQTLAALATVLTVVRGWLPGQPVRGVTIQLDGDVLELTGASRQREDELVQAWLARHGARPEASGT